MLLRGHARLHRLGWASFSLILVALASALEADPQSRRAEAAQAIADTNPRAASIYRRFAAGVVKIQVVEKGSSAKSTIGSGFFVDDSGTVVTNYHVISNLVHRPARYRVDVLGADENTTPATLLAIDVVHDLAVLRTGVRPPTYLHLNAGVLSRGDRLFSLGHPKDLSLSIVEGTYNGLLEHTLYPKIHFTGSLNPGMSGGPALDGVGGVVGVNVSTEGEQVSFLVPAEPVAELLARVRAPGFRAPTDFIADLGKQAQAYQSTYIREMFASEIPTITLGEYVLPTAPAKYFRCWADASTAEDKPFEISHHRCSAGDELYITDDQWAPLIKITHRYIRSSELNRFQFSTLYTYHFDAKKEDVYGDEDLVTRFQCRSGNVVNGATTLRTAFCIRGYRKLPGLYDAVLRTAVLGGRNTGAVTVLKLSGVSFDNAQLVARHYLERIGWKPR
jgi:hypothetical protein